ncbi:signal peptidase complex subunit 3 [Nematocida sp. AWRm80]|nr:signal peptidase complex subunit 3 [Nematocida sp. AWRm80]
MNTVHKRVMTVCSLAFNYLLILVALICLNSILYRNNSSNPIINEKYYNRIVFIPNLTNKIDYNTKEIYLYLVQSTRDKTKNVDSIIWSTLVKKDNKKILNNKINVRIDNTVNNALNKSTFILKQTHFPYIGLIKESTLGEVK